MVDKKTIYASYLRGSPWYTMSDFHTRDEGRAVTNDRKTRHTLGSLSKIYILDSLRMHATNWEWSRALLLA